MEYVVFLSDKPLVVEELSNEYYDLVDSCGNPWFGGTLQECVDYIVEHIKGKS